MAVASVFLCLRVPTTCWPYRKMNGSDVVARDHHYRVSRKCGCLCGLSFRYLILCFLQFCKRVHFEFLENGRPWVNNQTRLCVVDRDPPVSPYFLIFIGSVGICVCVYV